MTIIAKHTRESQTSRPPPCACSRTHTHAVRADTGSPSSPCTVAVEETLLPLPMTRRVKSRLEARDAPRDPPDRGGQGGVHP